ncbi:hypothetical protein C0J52_13052 [Blattella germanica]|nr:hypothetical protein C0J52_13052 [Blattella germanica]
MCLILRTGGSCCNLLREQPHPLAEDNLEEENEKLRQSSDGDHESSTMLKKQQIV